MRSRLVFLGVAAIMISAPAVAKSYLTIEQAQAEIFPRESFKQDLRTLSDAEAKLVAARTGQVVENRVVRAWRTSGGGWFIVDDVIGKHDNITYALGLNADGSVRGLEVLDYRESYGFEVRNPAWLAQFKTITRGVDPKFGREIKNISGATLSSRHLTDGVRRLLAVFAVALHG